MSREFDVVLFGASGFTGRLVAEYLARSAPRGTRIALAGRNLTKLGEIQRTLPEAGRAWPRLAADSANQGELNALAARTSVICTTVGPYAKYGLPLVDACARAGTHSCDLTGEVQFMREAIDRFDGLAKSTGARIVHTCGFDSIPSDLGVLLLHQALGKMTRATYVVESMKGGISGGTIASMLNLLDDAAKNPALRKLMADAYALSPDRSKEPDLGKERDQMNVRYDRFVGSWTAPFVMASVNSRVVRRSNALLDYEYGRTFRYAEVSGMGQGPKGFFAATALTAALGAFVAAVAFKPTKGLVEGRLPKPGEGPTDSQRKNGRLRVRLFGEAEDGKRAQVVVAGEGDPGYQLTSVMLGQAALCLALDEAQLPKRSGVLTPASAMGQVLIDRLKAAGMTWDVLSPR